MSGYVRLGHGGNLSICACKWSGPSSVSGWFCVVVLALEKLGEELAAVSPLPQEPHQFVLFFF